MPVRKSKGRRRGIQNGVQRHKLRSKQLPEEELEDSICLLNRARKYLNVVLFQLGPKSFQLASSMCCKFCLTPLIIDEDGRFRVAPFPRRFLNSILLACLGITCLHKMLATIMSFTVLDVGAVSAFLCYTGFQMQFTAMCTGVGLVCLPFLSCQVLNSWNPVLLEVSDRLSQPFRSPWNNPSCCLEALLIAMGAALATFALPAFSFVFHDAPIFILPSLTLGGIYRTGDDCITELLVQLGCYIFDVIICAAVLILMVFSVQLFVLQVGCLKAFVNSLR